MYTEDGRWTGQRAVSLQLLFHLSVVFAGYLVRLAFISKPRWPLNGEPRTSNNRQLRKETGRRMLQYASFAEVKQLLVSITMVRSGRNGPDRAYIDGKTVFNGNHLRSSSVREVTFRERGGRKGMPHGDSTVARVQKSRWYFSTT